MTINHSTLLLDQSAWDLVLDSAGDIAVATAPYSIAQDVASALRTFQGECWYDTSQGVPYWTQILGQYPALPLIEQTLKDIALTVPDVEKAQVIFTEYSARTLSGQVQVIDTDGVESGASFGG